jgi:MFS family permease
MRLAGLTGHRRVPPATRVMSAVPASTHPKPQADDTRRAAERWFLDRGLPSVLTIRARWRGLWPRSAPLFAATAAFEVCLLIVFVLTGHTEVDIIGTPTTMEWIVLAIVVVSLPLAALAGWLVSRLPIGRVRVVASTTAVVVAAAAGFVQTPVHLVVIAAVVAVALACTATGIGSVLGWALRLTVSQLAAVGALVVRALPVVLLTVLVFFNTYVWIMAATISRPRLWLAIAFLVAVAGVFVISATLERARPILRSATAPPGHAERLTGTPFEAMPDPPSADPLRATERLNVVFVLAATQLVQILTVAVVAAAIFFVLGLILLSPPLLAAWTRNGSAEGTLLSMTIPVPQALIQITLFLGALTFMYIGARAVGDGEYRSQFVDPLIDDLRLTLIARNRYRATSPERPAYKY